MGVVVVHLASTEEPRRYQQHGHHEHGEHVLRTHRHHRLEDELEVEVDSVERAETLRRRVGEEFAVQHEDATDEEQAQKHWHGERHVNRNGRRREMTGSRVVGRPREVIAAGQRVDGVDDHFQRDRQDTLRRHGQCPVV